MTWEAHAPSNIGGTGKGDVMCKREDLEQFFSMSFTCFYFANSAKIKA